MCLKKQIATPNRKRLAMPELVNRYGETTKFADDLNTTNRTAKEIAKLGMFTIVIHLINNEMKYAL